MNNTYILLVLVNILTKAEKRYFHLYANLQNGDKMYLALFNLIDANTSPEQLIHAFVRFKVELDKAKKLADRLMPKQVMTYVKPGFP